MEFLGLQKSRGAGVFPFVVKDKRVFFVLQQTFVGKKTGKWVDFGGGIDNDQRKIIVCSN
jgi:hypothetical protein